MFSGLSHLERSKITVSEPYLFKRKICYRSFRYLSTLYKKEFSGGPVKWFSLYASNNSDSAVFGSAAFGGIKDYSLRTTLFQKQMCYGRFSFASTLRKKVISWAPVKCVFLHGSNNSDSVFLVMSILQWSKITVWERPLFKKQIINGSFEFGSTLHEKVFSGAPVKCFTLYGSNNSDSVVFGDAAFRGIKKHSLRTTSFRHVSKLHKKVFSEAPVKCFSLYGSNNLDPVVFGNTTFGEIKDHILKIDTFSKRLTPFSTLCEKVFLGAAVKCVFLVFENAFFGLIKDHSLRTKSFQNKKLLWIGVCLSYVKKYFQDHQLSAFLFMAKKN